jgi:phosphoglycerate kinase
LKKKRTVRDIDVSGKGVLLRADLNVPFAPITTFPSIPVISDDSRIQAVLPTIRYLKKHGSRIIICSHLGRPDGKVVKELRLWPVALRLQELLGEPLIYIRNFVGPIVQDVVAELEPGQVLLLENLRFDPREEKNDHEFAKALGSLADVYINDAFGAAHRAHASIEAITNYLPAVAGLQMERELKMLGAALDNPVRPLGAVVGGAKVSDKIDAIKNLLQLVDRLFLGGGLATTFLKAQGHEVGHSLVEEERMDVALDILRDAKSQGVTVYLPSDMVVADYFAAYAPHWTAIINQIPKDSQVMDIGPQTVQAFTQGLKECRTVIWNGPMGVFEFEPFSVGTRSIAEAMADLDGAITVVGGGSTAEAVQEMGLSNSMNHVSMGGGASLEFMEGRDLPGIATLLEKD